VDGNNAGDEDEWDAVDEAHGWSGRRKNSRHKNWLPDNIEPILEEQPKWSLLADILLEIEDEMIKRPMPPCKNPLLLSPRCLMYFLTIASLGTNAVLVMVGSSIVANDLKEYLSKLPDEAAPGTSDRGRSMMENRLRKYLHWKAAFSRKEKGRAQKMCADKAKDSTPSDALRLKDKLLQQRAANRRRIRGGTPTTTSQRTTDSKGKGIGGDGQVEEGLYAEAGDFADLYVGTFPKISY
jgi:DNA excision repair protein ERCC-4